MRQFGLIMALAFFALVSGYSQDANIKGAWVPVNLKWVPDRYSPNPHQKWAQSEVLFFSDNDHFSLLQCTLGQRESKFFVSEGDAQVVSLGSWHLTESSIAIKYRLVYRTVEITGGNAPEEEHNDTLKISNGTLVFHGTTFRKESRLNASVEKDLSGVHPEGNP
jgi:hypothetical protein